ncbi:MAG: hypothetical protein CMJ50_09205 [Planctomycetaceae bacterium]|nr:hypothetical protein [Planctomycetaceae bacterium]
MRHCVKVMILSGFLVTTVAMLAQHWSGAGAAQQPSQLPGNVPTVFDFGAIGDGETDDTAAIQRAVDASVGEVRFPRGIFRITKTIRVHLDEVGPTSIVAGGTARIVMAGPGPAFKFIGTHGGTASPHTVKPNVWERQRTPMIDGIEVVGDHSEAIGIEATGTMQAIFSRVTIRNALHGIHLTTRNRNVIVSACHLYDNRGVGLYLDGLNLHQVNVDNSHISYNKMGGIVVRDSEIRNLQIANCDIEGNMSDSTEPTANILIDTTNGSVREGAIVGCTIQHTHNAPKSANVRFIGTGREIANKVGHFCISDNAMSDVAVNIHLQYARGVIITGNTLWKGFTHNLLVEGSSNIVVGPNLFDRNPDYGPKGSTNALVFRNCHDCTLNGLHINNVMEAPAGLMLKNCSWINVTGCTILDCDNVGLSLQNCDHCRVSDCIVRDTRTGVTNPVAISVTGGRENQLGQNLTVGQRKIELESLKAGNSSTSQ